MIIALVAALLISADADDNPPTLHFMPVPKHVEQVDEPPLRITGDFTVGLIAHSDDRLLRAVSRFVARLQSQTGIPLPHATRSRTPVLSIEVGAPRPDIPVLGEDESYSLDISADGAHLRAPTPYGALRGLQTFLQAVRVDSTGFSAPALRIMDEPRFPWRGLLMDVCRHWLPIDVIKRNLDAMEAVKLNVLHFHLSEDQGFRVESKVHPRLHGMGSDGLYFSQEELREIVAYAADRGIRVVPEFDMPGHATSWLVGYPELASAPGPYEIERGYGIKLPVMDPTRDEVYDFLEEFIGEMSGIFPDEYFHIGGDEVKPDHWLANSSIVAFMERNQFESPEALQAMFNRRVRDILAKNGRRMVGWDEILHAGVPDDIVIQSWRGTTALADAARRGYSGLLSNGYYLDLLQPASQHYAVDPLGAEAAGMSADEQARVLGGEACMWAELVTSDNVDSRIWPRAAAIAERLWSPQSVTDTGDMYRRLAPTSSWLRWTGVTHLDYQRRMLERIAGGAPVAALETLASVVEPIKGYTRHRHRTYSSLDPMNRFVDAAKPESTVAREFEAIVSRVTAGSLEPRDADRVRKWAKSWEEQHSALKPYFKSSSQLAEIERISEIVAAIGQMIRQLIEADAPLDPSIMRAFDRLVAIASEPHAEVDVMISSPAKDLLGAIDNGGLSK